MDNLSLVIFTIVLQASAGLYCLNAIWNFRNTGSKDVSISEYRIALLSFFLALAGMIAGVLLGLSYALAGFLMSRRAQSSPGTFMLWVVGGMGIRMFVALGVVAIVIAFAPVDTTTFVGSFITLFVLGLIVDIVIALRRHEP